jgi:hypothetical protein
MMEVIDELMDMIGAYASSWALVGGPFDTGDGMDRAKEAKKAIRAALESALSVAKVEPSPMDASAPPRVWLQVDDQGDNEDRSETIPETSWCDLTWCSESIGGQEIEYVRVDRPWVPKVEEDEA